MCYFGYLEGIGMAVNRSKTDTTYFGKKSEPCSIKIDEEIKKTQSIDEVPSVVIRDLSIALTLPLTWLFNKIVETGLVPNAWKISRIVPTFKKGKKDLINYYRPVSNTSSLSKVFENCLIQKIGGLMQYDELMGSHQFAYRPGCSTVTACLSLQDFIATEMDMGNKVIMYSTDLTSAFDLLRPSILVKNMLSMGLPKRLITIIYDFLNNRTGFVDVNNTFNDLKCIPLGCVQGSVLGPFLFNIYTRGLEQLITSNVEKSKAFAYADDVYVGISVPPNSLAEAKPMVEQIFGNHKKWLESLGMICNATKTELIVFGNTGDQWSMTVGSETINASNTIKILGLTFEKHLRWGQHVAIALKKANSMTCSLRVLNNILSWKSHRQIIHSLFISKLMYGSQVWAGCINSIDTRKINTVLFKVMRVHCKDNARILRNSQLCEISNMRTFNSMRIIFDAVMLHSLVSNPLSTNLTLRLIEQSSVSSRYPSKLIFFDYSRKKVGSTSFVNRAKKISATIPFDWLDQTKDAFTWKMKRNTLNFIT